MDALNTVFLIVIFLFFEWLDFAIAGLLDNFNPHLALAALIFASVAIILKKLNTLLKQTKEQKSDEPKSDDSSEEK